LPVTITIDGVDQTLRVRMETIEIRDSIPARMDTAQFDMIILSADIANRPVSGNEVSIDVDGSIEFAGEVTTAQEVRLINPDAYLYQITCNDWSRRLDRQLVVIQEIGPSLAGDIVKEVLGDFAPEFAVDLTQIQDGVLIPEQQYDYSTVSSILDQLATLSGYVWYIDVDKVLHFIPPPDFISPLTGNQYDVDTDLQLGDMAWQEDASQVKNRIFLKDGVVPDADSRQDTFISDGVASFFSLFQEPEGVGTTSVVSKKPDGSTKMWNPALDPLDAAEGTLRGDPDTVYVCLLNVGIRFPLDSEDKVVLEPNEIIEVTTKPMREDIVFMVEDIDSQKMMADREGLTWGQGTAGIYEHMESLDGARLGSQESAEAYGLILLTQTAWPEVTGTFRTQQLKGWKAGQTFDLKSSKRDLFDAETFWKTAVKVDIPVWVQQVTKQVLPAEDQPDGVVFETIVEFANRAIMG